MGWQVLFKFSLDLQFYLKCATLKRKHKAALKRGSSRMLSWPGMCALQVWAHFKTFMRYTVDFKTIQDINYLNIQKTDD